MARAQLLLTSLLVLTVVAAGCNQVVNDVTNGPSNTWALENTQLAELHDRGIQGQGVLIGVVDTGIQASHGEFEDMPGRLLWADVVNGQQEPYDDGGHGTHVSGILIAQGNGGLGAPVTKGGAPGAGMIHVKAIPGGQNAQGSGSDVAEAIDRAVNRGADVLVLSLGGEPGLLPIGQQTEDAVNRAIDKGVVVVAAAGNAEDGESGSSCTVKSPASLRRVIAVGAVDRENTIAPFSCTGDNSGGPLGVMAPQDPNKKPELVAPGVGIVGPSPRCAGQTSEYCSLSGTSQAAPYVGAVVALLLQEHPEMQRQDADTVEQIKQALIGSAEKVWGGTGHHDRYGYGLVQADGAMQRLG